MALTGSELLTLVHGLGFGAVFLLAYSGALEGLWGLSPERVGGAGAVARRHRLSVAVCGMALLAWLAVLTGLYGVYPLYRAVPPVGADLRQFPQFYLLADPMLAAWDTFAAAWKAHIACLCPILTTAVAAVVLRYGPELADQVQIRRALGVLLTLAFVTAGLAGALGALLTKVAPVQ